MQVEIKDDIQIQNQEDQKPDISDQPNIVVQKDTNENSDSNNKEVPPQEELVEKSDILEAENLVEDEKQKDIIDKLDEAKSDEEIELPPPKELHNLPGEKEAWVGASTYNLDEMNLEGDINNSMSPFQDNKPKKVIKKPSMVPKKTIPIVEKLDDDLGLIKLTKDESERRLSEYVSPMIMNKLRSQKWESKVQGIEWLQEWFIYNNVPPELWEYAFRYLKGIMKDWKETNTNILKANSEFLLGLLQNASRLGKRSIAIIIPYLWDNLNNNLLNIQALESIIKCAELNQSCFGKHKFVLKSINYRISSIYNQTAYEVWTKSY